MTDQNNAAQAVDQEIEAIMEQAQVFASAWAFYGGPFDQGEGKEQAEREEATLRDVIRDALSKLRAEGAQAVGYVHPDTLAQLAFPMTPYREVPLYRVHRPHPEFDAKRPAGLVPIYTAPPAALASAPVAGEAHTALNEWFDKTDFIQKRIASGELPVKYLGWHRADVMRDLIEQPRPSDDKLWDQTLTERDEYHDIADKLANAIADHLLVEIGEHSSSNCPWMRALEAIESAAPQTSEAVCSCPTGDGSLRWPCAVHRDAEDHR